MKWEGFSPFQISTKRVNFTCMNEGPNSTRRTLNLDKIDLQTFDEKESELHARKPRLDKLR